MGNDSHFIVQLQIPTRKLKIAPLFSTAIVPPISQR